MSKFGRGQLKVFPSDCCGELWEVIFRGGGGEQMFKEPEQGLGVG